MGCACSRSSLGSDEAKNELRDKTKSTNKESNSARDSAKYTKIDEDDSFNPSLNQDSSVNAQSGSKASLLKPISNIFLKKNRKEESTSNLDNSGKSSNLNLSASLSSNQQSQKGQNLLNSSLNYSSNSQFKSQLSQSQQAVINNTYSIFNLPIKTQYLLNSHDDIEKLSFYIENDLDNTNGSNANHNKSNSKKLNNEIQAYLSLPYVKDSITNDLHKKSLNLIYKYLNEPIDNTIVKLEDKKITDLCSTCSLIEFLRLYCAQHKIQNCDLNLINLNQISSNSNNFLLNKNDSSSNSTFNLINNIYFRRSLGKTILHDLFNFKKSNFFQYHQYNSFLSGFSLFVIILSEIQFEQDTKENLLCPDQIELSDYKKYLEKQLSKSSLTDIFQKYYKYDRNQQLYKLDIDFFNMTSSFEVDLDKLLDFFLQQKDDDSNDHFRLKYVKTIQQEEIEIITTYADPQSIIWAHLTVETNQKSSMEKLCFNFNRKRYSSVLNLLQTKVLTNKYKQIKLNQMDEADFSIYKQILSEFVYNCVKSLIDIYVYELSKNQNELFALKIDKQLSQEIYRHYEYFKYLKNLNYSNSNSFKLETTLNEYIADKSNSYNYPLLILNNHSTSNTKFSTIAESNTYLNILISKWLNKLIQNNQHLDDHIFKPSIIYRYCSHTVLSSEITTLLQNVLHQLCYLLEIHESFAFDNPETVFTNISKALESYFSLNENTRKEIIIVINCLDNVIKTNYDLNLLEKFLTKIYTSRKASNLKIILTLSSFNRSETNSYLSQLVKNLETQYSTKTLNMINFEFNSKAQNDTLVNLDEKLNNYLFNNNKNLSNLTKFVLYLLNESRYGLKQSELFDLCTSSNLNLNMNQISQNELNHIFVILWYTLKYYSNSIEIMNDNNQILYKIKCSSDSNKSDLNEIVYSFYNRSSSIGNKGRFISHFNNRVFYELPKYFYLTNQEQCNNLSDLKEFYLNEFILNPKWILNKSYICSSILYFMHDLVYFKNLFQDLNTNDDDLNSLESFLYQKLYELNQDQNQFYLHSKLNDKIKNLLKNSEFINKSNSLNTYPQLFLYNQSNFLNQNSLLNTNMFDLKNKELIYFSKIFYLSKYHFLTLSEQPYNEIKIWKIENNSSNIEHVKLIRSIKFNKSPRDLRLINKHTAVVLIERNLHLINLDKGLHVFDLNSTMNPNLALFEIHDSNHVVLLARNRLSVILMKVPTHLKQSQLEQSIKSTSEDMFLFKVGEDRYLNSLLVSKNGKIMVCGDEVQKPFPLLVWNLDKRKLVYDLRQAKHEFITSIQSMSSSGKYVVTACQEDGEAKNCLIVYDLTTGQLYKKLKAKENFVSVEISEESNVIISCLENSQILVYDLENGSKKFTIYSNRFPINKIKILDSNQIFKNFFLTYDTLGYDWTIRLWDLTKGDQLISSITCPSRIISLDVNCSRPNFDDSTESNNDIDDSDLFITASLYGIKELFIIKLDFFNNKNKFIQNNNDKFGEQDDESIDQQKQINL